MKKCKLKILDIIRTPKGQIAFVEEISSKDWGGFWDIAVEYLGKIDKFGEGNAWFDVNELVKIDSIPSIVKRIQKSQTELQDFYSRLVEIAMDELHENS